MPYREWCCHCVRGAGKAADHRAQEHAERAVPEFHMDYMFMGTDKITAKDDARATTMLVVKEKDRKMHMATVVPKKGSSIDWVAKRINAFIDEMGCAGCPVMIKSDQEASIKDLINDVKRLRSTAETLQEFSPVGSSASNGVIERGIQIVQNVIRTIKDCLEMRWKLKIESNSPVLAWLTEYSAVLVNRYQVGHDGKTGYERTRGKKSRMLGFEFGELMMFRRTPIGPRLAKLESLWETGVYVGYKSLSGEYMCSTATGVYKSRNVKRKPVEERWSGENMNMVKGVPWCANGNDGKFDDIMPAIQIEVKEPGVEVMAPRSREDVALPRRVYINRKDIDVHGPTPGCAGCVAIIQNKAPAHHSEDCRTRIEAKIKETTRGQKRVGDAEHRQKSFLAKHIEESDKRRKRLRDGEDIPSAEGPSTSSSSSGPKNMEIEKDEKGEKVEDKYETWKEKQVMADEYMNDDDASYEEWKEKQDEADEYMAEQDKKVEQNMDITELRKKYKEYKRPRNRWADENNDETYECPWNTKYIYIDLDSATMDEKQYALDNVTVAQLTCEEPDDMEQYMEDYYDDVTGKILDSNEVMKARQNEIDELIRLQVFDKVHTDQCWQHTGRAPITARWIDIDKGDEQKHVYRSRFVAREIKSKYGGAEREDLFAATPPWEAIKLLLSNIVTNHSKDYKLMMIDISKAYLFAPVVHEHIYVDLPPEIGEPGMCARLKKALYGTRDAAHAWEQEYTRSLIEFGFVAGLSSACIFMHQELRLELVVHGDDFTIAGPQANLKKFADFLSTKYLVKIRGTLGSGPTDDDEITLLNRVIKWGPQGISLEADPRHTELVIKDLGLDMNTNGSTIPGAKSPGQEDDTVLDKVMTTKYRSITARLNYMVSDRADIQYSVKELCREMSSPTEASWAKLKKVGRYLITRPRLLIHFMYQDTTQVFDIYTDSDWAGCTRTRKSTNGGCAMRGSHTLKTWSSTQGIIALSSGEAEYYGTTKAGVVALGFMQLCKDFNLEQKFNIHMDSTAAKGICHRTGTGKLKHMDIQYLWIQQHVRMKSFTIKKIWGKENPADLMTKYLDKATIDKMVEKLFMEYMSGRARTAPHLAA